MNEPTTDQLTLNQNSDRDAAMTYDECLTESVDKPAPNSGLTGVYSATFSNESEIMKAQRLESPQLSTLPNAPGSSLASAPAPTETEAQSNGKSSPAANGATKQRKPRGGAPIGNRNAMSHGLRASQLPKKCKPEEMAIYSFRRQLLDALTVVRGVGALTFADEATVNRAVRYETTARLAARWLRLETDASLADRLKLLETNINATEARDKAIASLGIVPGGKSIPAGGASIYGEDTQ